jgi:RNA polymerase sigma factor (sigma-70 family)
MNHLFRDPTDPAVIVETEEAARWLQAAVAGLDEECRQIWQRLCEGIGLREIAGELGISYDSAKRRRRKLIEKLKFHLRKPASLGDSEDRGEELPVDLPGE